MYGSRDISVSFSRTTNTLWLLTVTVSQPAAWTALNSLYLCLSRFVSRS